MLTRRGSWVTPFLVLLVLVGAVLVLRPVTYRAAATLGVADGTSATEVVEAVSGDPTRDTVLTQMQAEPGLTDGVRIEARVLSGPEDGSAPSEVEIEVGHPDPRFASALVDGVAADAAGTGGVSVAELSEVATVPDGPRPWLLLAAGAVLSLLVAVVGTVLAGRLRGGTG